MAMLSSSTQRKSLPLSDRDLRDLDKLRGSDAHRAALARYTSTTVTETSSEAAILHAIFEAGMRAVREQVEEQGYAQMAAERDYDQRAVARRRRPSWADE